MNSSNSAGLTPRDCIKLLAEHRHRWIKATLVCAVLATAYSLVMSRYWEATQALVVRQEVTASESGPIGRFADLYQMRTFQETILELAKSRQVIAATIQEVDTLEAGEPVDPPSDKAIEKFRKRLSMLPPGGAEFGKTEVFYLGVKDTDRDRAIQLVDTLSRKLDIRLRQLRDEQAQSLIDELDQQVQLASEAQAQVTTALLEFESTVGRDLGELRMLHSANSGQSDLRQRAVQLEQESRLEAAKMSEAEQLLTVLNSALHEPDHLVALPNSLLNSQPTLTRLKNGLFESQLRLARLGGTSTEDHPKVIAAKEAVQQIRRDLHTELKVAVQGVEVELELSRQRHTNSKNQLDTLNDRLGKLAGLRAEYSNRVAAVENSRKVLDQARQQLTEARAQQASASATSLVTAIDRPDAGSSPAGMRRASVVLLGALGGLVIGLGWTFLAVEFSAPESTEPSATASTPTQPTPRQRPTQQVNTPIFPTGVTYTPYYPNAK